MASWKLAAEIHEKRVRLMGLMWAHRADPAVSAMFDALLENDVTREKTDVFDDIVDSLEKASRKALAECAMLETALTEIVLSDEADGALITEARERYLVAKQAAFKAERKAADYSAINNAFIHFEKD